MAKVFVPEAVNAVADFIPKRDCKALRGRKEITEFIHRRRRQLIVHSIIYYRMNDNVVSDHTWQRWANELRDIQNQFPEYCNIGFYDELFVDWTGATGYNLDVPEMVPTAEMVLRLHYVLSNPV